MIQLLSGDCLEVMKDLSDNSIDCFVCDLPYGQLNAGRKEADKTYGQLQAGTDKGKLCDRPVNNCAWDVKIDLEAFWIQVKRLARNENTPVLMFCNTRFGIELINSNPKWFRYDLVWNKVRGVSFLSVNKQPMKSHEMIYVFSKKGAYYKRVDVDDPTKKAHSQYYKDISNTTRSDNVYTTSDSKLTLSKGCEDGKRCPLSVINLPKVGTFKDKHPTEKPVELYKWLLSRYCPDAGTVLDPTAGSFNSIKAAQELNLNGIGIEKDKRFYDNAVTAFAQ
jgi:site-specific DNA-methyltransferase (adenine-specific)